MSSAALTARPPSPAPRQRILAVDDDAVIRAVLTNILETAGYDVVTAADGETALQRFSESHFDGVITDLAMAGLSGVDLLRALRERDLDLQVVFFTADTRVEAVTQALNAGAFRLLTKPCEPEALVAAVKHAVSATKVERAKREAYESSTRTIARGDRSGLDVTFDRALSAVWMAFQPIVRWSTREVVAYEALVRSGEPAMPNPGMLLDAAERLGRVHDVGRTVRRLAPARFLEAAPAGAKLFLNLHTTDLLDEALYEPDDALLALSDRVVFELTERASLEEVADVRARVARLRELGFAVALDDIGAGYAGLNSYVLLEPDVVKIDMTLVRDVDRTPVKQRLVRSLVAMCQGQLVVAEGVETRGELDTLVGLGCDVFQGYLFARPDAAFVAPRFP